MTSQRNSKNIWVILVDLSLLNCQALLADKLQNYVKHIPCETNTIMDDPTNNQKLEILIY
jgi:hypothetical protein